MRAPEIDALLTSKSVPDREKCIALLTKHLLTSPADVQSWYDLACCFDFLGHEAEAEPNYKKVFEMGSEKLKPQDEMGFYIGYGSTLRNLKKYDEAKKILLIGITKFPEVMALKSFLGLAEYSDGIYRKAARLFLASSLPSSNDTSLVKYSRALRSYLEQIDTYPARQRNWMRIYLHDCLAPNVHPHITPIKIEQVEQLARLMDVAYSGTIDHEGESIDQCAAEMKSTIESKYGPFLAEASFAVSEDNKAVSASMITLWKNNPLLAFSMTDPAYQGRGLAELLIRKSMFALKSSGYKALYLVVTEGNTPAERLYQKIGFEFLGPALPGKGLGIQSL